MLWKNFDFPLVFEFINVNTFQRRLLVLSKCLRIETAGVLFISQNVCFSCIISWKYVHYWMQYFPFEFFWVKTYLQTSFSLQLSVLGTRWMLSRYKFRAAKFLLKSVCGSDQMINFCALYRKIRNDEGNWKKIALKGFLIRAFTHENQTILFMEQVCCLHGEVCIYFAKTLSSKILPQKKHCGIWLFRVATG